MKKLTLKERFTQLLSLYSQDTELVSTLWNEIETHYTEKHRTYHNLKHLDEIFSYFDTYENELENSNLISFSIFYHDVIYNIWKKDNEEKSADFAMQELQELLSKNDLSTIFNQILATKTHEGSDNDTRFLIDFDLAILGQSSEVYQQYAKLIRKEYKLIPEIVYKKGRKKVLQHFINKPFIYKTDTFINLYEKQAKLNLKTELNKL
ncbi:HD domain-containing protein [Tenacibaculum agarivorans]|uniref:HD domain-containing protein n=1 Tax=Tenacibaculum agarivorans TaxID=1908389 RepID=UPI001F186E7E|nr:hypothetical protein [Tenacibaculum agarivorans]